MNKADYNVQSMNSRDRENDVTLELLQAIDQRSDLSQRHLADRLGIALGLINAYLKRCIRKGLVKVKQAPANRYLYYLTPRGFSEKSRLTAIFLKSSFDFYRDASASVGRTLTDCERSNWRTIALAGASELAEIALVRAREHAVEVVSVLDPDHGADRFLDLPILRSANALGTVDAVIVTAIVAPEKLYRNLIAEFDPARVLVPDVLGVRTQGA